MEVKQHSMEPRKCKECGNPISPWSSSGLCHSCSARRNLKKARRGN